MDPSLNTRQTNKTRAELGKVVKMIATHTMSELRTIRIKKLTISSCIQLSQQISLSQHKIYKNFRPIPHEIPKAAARALNRGKHSRRNHKDMHSSAKVAALPTWPFFTTRLGAITPKNPFEINKKSATFNNRI